ncbi:MAG TPA: NAD(P)H-dependent glycerol-3-phosphate dehydrogenase [Actinomycetota bacterium]|nr:NAD(P)H-dependent glycerol-3-phosphate dehydrogenase [Actinomycetota bacterium]
MTTIAVFGAGAMGTAVAMHAARRGHATSLWANRFDLQAFAELRADRKHPLLGEHLPDGVRLFGPNELDDAAAGAEIVVLGANSHGARSLAGMVRDHVGDATALVSVAKGLEPGTGARMSEVYGEELPGPTIVAVGGPCLAAELAGGLPTAGVWAAADEATVRAAGAAFDDRHYQLTYTDDVIGVELAAMMKNVAAIGLGILDGIGTPSGEGYKNAKAALFTKAAHEIVALVTASGGRAETALGLAGVGDQLVTSLGGRNRLYGEMVGAGDPPADTLAELERRGLTVEGVDSTREVARLARELALDLPYHAAIHRVLFEGADPRDILEVLR